MIWDLFGFIKRIALNIGIHVCWYLFYLLMDAMYISSGFGIDILGEIGHIYWNERLVTIPITVVAFVIWIYKVYKKNPCKSIMGACIYWLISTLLSTYLVLINFV